MIKRYVHILILMVFLTSTCERKINLDIPHTHPQLVVEGILTNTSGPHIIQLTKTSAYSSHYDTTSLDYEENAIVILEDSNGYQDTLEEFQPGKYRANESYPLPGRTYTLHIFRSNGEYYTSKPEKMLQPSKIQDINYRFDENATWSENPERIKITVSIDWVEDGSTLNYYLRNSLYYWNGSWHDNIQWSKIFSDESINGLEIKDDITWNSYGTPGFIYQVNQYTISKEAYEYMRIILAQVYDNDGWTPSIAVPHPGNVYNADYPERYALGYFIVAGVSSASTIIE